MAQQIWALRGIAVMCLFFSMAAQYCVNYRAPLTGALLAVSAAGVIAAAFAGRACGYRRALYVGAFGVQAIAAVSFLAAGNYGCFLASLIVSGAAALAAAAETLASIRRSKVWAVVLCIVLSSAYILGAAWNISDGISAQPYLRLFWGTDNNSYDAPPIQTTLLENGTTCISDIPYAEEYPNSYLDLYLSPDAAEGPLPTFIFIHGGGFMGGDKAEGDPFASAESGQLWYLNKLVEAGYNVVSLNYAMTPVYSYPVPMLQVAQAVGYLQINAGVYGLDMRRVVLAGSSAGGNIAGTFALAQSDPAYAQKTGIPRVMEEGGLRAVVFLSALIDGRRMATMDNIFSDYLLYECSRSYFRSNDYANSEAAWQANIIARADENFPAAYISDGNSNSFAAQAFEFYDRLRQLGVVAELNYYGEEIARLGHGFEFERSAQAEDNLAKTIAFLNEQCL